jgi:undecaprenyl-diphosphatase
MRETYPLIERFDMAELSLCSRLNRLSLHAWICRPFQAASWLGDGYAWFALAATLIAFHGSAAVPLVATMTVTSVAGVTIYKSLKRRLVRERPFIRHLAIRHAMAPLDRYSFPSGHTLHAVSITWQVVAHYPECGWVLVPLVVLIALSRVVLGLHYPTDVLAGAALGAGLGAAGVALTA